MDEAGLQPGDVVADRYEIEGRVGAGGMGAVYAAADRRLGRKVALKTLVHGAKPGDSKPASSLARRRLEAEARIVASLEHPAIVRIYDVIDGESGLLLVMEFVSGVSLRARLEREGTLTHTEAARIVGEVAEGLSAAHAQGLVHRDIKPENVMIRDDGRVALLDFGIAKVVASAAQAPHGPTLTVSGDLLGTPMYLSPEQVEGGEVGPATDQFALAVMGYELVSGGVPWRTDSLGFLFADILKATPPAAASIAVGSALDDVFLRALAKSPAARFPNVLAFASAFTEALVGENLGVVDAIRAVRKTTDAGGPLGGRTHDPLSETQSPMSSASAEAAADAARDIEERDDQEPAIEDGALESSGHAPNPIEEAPVLAGESARRTAGTASVKLVPTQVGTRKRARWLPFALGALIVAGVGGVVRYALDRSTGHGSPTSATSSASASSAGSALPLVEDAPSHTDNADALESYRSAVRALHVADPSSARRLLEKAIAEDPRFASALVQRAYLSVVVAPPHDAAGRSAFRNAMGAREQLPPRDAEFLDAMTPAFLDPPDWLEARTKLAAFADSHPHDAQVWVAMAALDFKRGDLPATQANVDRALEADPKNGLALLFRAQLDVQLGDMDRAHRDLEACTRAVPESVGCRLSFGIYAANVGDCREADRLAREVAAFAPDQPKAFDIRAMASAGLGADEASIRELLDQREKAAPASEQSAVRATDSFRLAMRRGDFNAAVQAIRERERIAESVDPMGAIALAKAAVLFEMGKGEEAAGAAEEYLRLAAARPVPERSFLDPTGRLLGYVAAVRPNDPAVRTRVDAWTNDWKSRLGDTGMQAYGHSLWMDAFFTPGDIAPTAAKTALDERPSFHAETLPMLTMITSPENGFAHVTSVGAIFLAVGDLDGAEKLLQWGAKTCSVVPDVRARYLLGVLAEKRHDQKAACAAYAEVEKIWGKAVPRSVTAEAARKRARDCPRND